MNLDRKFYTSISSSGGGQENINAKYEHAHVLAEVITDEFLKNYDLIDGGQTQHKTEAPYDQAMEFWNYRLFLNNKSKKPESKGELIKVFEDVINEFYQNSITQTHGQNREKDTVDYFNEIYKFFVLHDPNVHKYHITTFKHGIESGLRKKYDQT